VPQWPEAALSCHHLMSGAPAFEAMPGGERCCETRHARGEMSGHWSCPCQELRFGRVFLRMGWTPSALQQHCSSPRNTQPCLARRLSELGPALTPYSCAFRFLSLQYVLAQWYQVAKKIQGLLGASSLVPILCWPPHPSWPCMAQQGHHEHCGGACSPVMTHNPPKG
jgi:hypothetical protein